MNSTTEEAFNNTTTEIVEDRYPASLAIFYILFVANMLMGIILSAYNHSRPDSNHQSNVLFMLQIHLGDTLPVVNAALILPSIFRLAIGPLPHFAAVLLVKLGYSLICYLLILTAASSALKLLLVVNFDLVFTTDPSQLVKRIVAGAALASLMPNLAAALWFLSGGRQCCSSNSVEYFTGHPVGPLSMSFSAGYMLVWMAVSLTLIVLVIVGIPIYLKRYHTSLAIRMVDKLFPKLKDAFDPNPSCCLKGQ
jgi:hypothetical protein